MQTILIDTNVLLVLMGAPGVRPLKQDMIDMLEGVDTMLVSAASVYEVNQKARIGKLDMPEIDDARLDAMHGEGLSLLSLTPDLMARAAALDWTYRGQSHRDPFDRMIAATALARQAPLMSSDAAFDALGIERIWT